MSAWRSAVCRSLDIPAKCWHTHTVLCLAKHVQRVETFCLYFASCALLSWNYGYHSITFNNLFCCYCDDIVCLELHRTHRVRTFHLNVCSIFTKPLVTKNIVDGYNALLLFTHGTSSTICHAYYAVMYVFPTNVTYYCYLCNRA